MKWTTLGAVAPERLVGARRQLHHAAQIVASTGMTYLAPTADDRHPNMGWDADRAALIGRSLPGATARVALRPADLSLLLIGAHGDGLDALTLDGRRFDEALD